MHINWLSISQLRKKETGSEFDLLTESGSLTKRIKNNCNGDFSVHLIDHQTIKMDVAQQQLLSATSPALQRRIFLCCNKQPLIFAKTIVALTPENKRLTKKIAKLGENSLGHLLFKDLKAIKLSTKYAYISAKHAFFDQCIDTTKPEIKLRRNLYQYKNCKLLVYEAFL